MESERRGEALLLAMAALSIFNASAGVRKGGSGRVGWALAEAKRGPEQQQRRLRETGQRRTMTLEQLLKDGARAMAETRYEDAVEIYSEACQMANLEQGKDDPDLMYLYGKALFENAVQSSDVLGGVGKEKERKEKVEKENEEKEEEEKEGEAKKCGGDGQFQFNERLAEEEEEEEKEEKEEKANSDSDEEVEAPAEGDGEAEQGDFEIAWEILDLTRILYGEQLDEMAAVPEPYEAHAAEGQDFVTKFARLADVYMLMGDISLETENFPQAAEDYEKGNRMLEKAFAETSGRRHEALFKLSLAHEFGGSDESLQRAVSCMETVLAMVEHREKKEAAGSDGIVEEVRSRLADLRTLQQQRAAEKEQLVALFKGVTGAVAGATGGRGDNAPAVRDLTGLVKSRKKKKPSGRVCKR